MHTATSNNKATFSVPSIIAIVSAILSFATGAVLGMIFALCAIVSGLIGVVVALSPSKRGGIASTMAIFAGVIGIIAAIIKLIMWIL